MTELIFPAVVIGLWSWLFTETLTKGDHVFAFVGRMVDGREPQGMAQRLFFQYVRCPICHAGALGLLYAVFCLVAACLAVAVVAFAGIDLLPAIYLIGNALTSLFIIPVLAMSVAKVMALKF